MAADSVGKSGAHSVGERAASLVDKMVGLSVENSAISMAALLVAWWGVHLADLTVDEKGVPTAAPWAYCWAD